MSRRVEFDELEVVDSSVHHHDGAPFTGIAYETALAGWLTEEMTFVEGIQTGVAREFDREGKVIVEEHYLSGKLHGQRKKWHPNGQLANDEKYEFGTLVAANRWDEKGAPLSPFVLQAGDPRWAEIERHRKILRGE